MIALGLATVAASEVLRRTHVLARLSVMMTIATKATAVVRHRYASDRQKEHLMRGYAVRLLRHCAQLAVVFAACLLPFVVVAITDGTGGEYTMARLEQLDTLLILSVLAGIYLYLRERFA